MAKFFLGIDVGGTNIAAALVNKNGECSFRSKIASPRDNTQDAFMSTLENMIDNLLNEAGIKPSNLKGIGIGVPGLVDPQTNQVVNAPNLNLAGIDIAGQLSKRYETPVKLGNDVNLGLLGEQWLGAARGTQNVIGLFLGTGVGGGIILNNQLILGAHGAAAELGHLQVDPNGPMCTCGNQGCLEAYAGRWAIERDIRAGLADHKDSMIIKLTDGDLSQIKSKTLAKALRAADPLITRIIQNAAQQLGKACISLRHVFDPELIILGGGVVEACGEYFLPLVKTALAADPLFAKFPTCEVVASQLGDDAIILGAVAQFSHHGEDKPAKAKKTKKKNKK